MEAIIPHPRHVPQVMVSSTYTDLKEHRGALIAALHKHKLHANVMEHDDAKVGGDVVDSSLRMVRDSAAYILLVSQKYGQVPECPDRNPSLVSITELEFDEAQRLKRPTLLFIMGEDHPIKKGDIERERQKETKLNAFRQRAKLASPGGKVNRVYAVFNSIEEFKDKIAAPLTELCKILEANDGPASGPPSPVEKPGSDSVPKAPAFYAEPDYLGSHTFVGRDSQLQELSDWAKPADPTNLLLFEAIGGNGKSMLTWEWATKPQHALAARPAADPWAGRFWYSFYERGAVMADFCQRALAYVTGRPLEEFAKKKTTELAKHLLAHLHARPWLLILDGLERVLVHYHRFDAAEIPDEEANAPTDKIVNRDPCDAIREEDNDLLRALAGAKPSKILVSSRLTPRVLLNPAGQTIPGARRINLPGLRPADAEALLRSCDVTGGSAAIQAYLTENCDNHPLVIGVLGGLINKPGPNRGNFDAWVTDPDGGAKLDLASLDLIQRRNHILRAALDALPPAGQQLLSTLALLSESVDYETLSAFNPHLPPEPEEVTKPEPPEKYPLWNRLSDERKAERRERYEADLESSKNYEKAVQDRLASVEYRTAPKRLTETVGDLERRGLLQWDSRDRKYNLHPVVRSVAAGALKAAEKENYGRRVVDYFSSVPHNPYEDAETLEDLSPGLHVVRTLLKLGHFEQAATAYHSGLGVALFINLEAYPETLSLLKPFFPEGWANPPLGLSGYTAAELTNYLAANLLNLSELDDALVAFSASLLIDVESKDWFSANIRIHNIALTLSDQDRRKDTLRVVALKLDVAACTKSDQDLFTGRLSLFAEQARLGWAAEAEGTWKLLDPMGRSWSRAA